MEEEEKEEGRAEEMEEGNKEREWGHGKGRIKEKVVKRCVLVLP